MRVEQGLHERLVRAFTEDQVDGLALARSRRFAVPGELAIATIDDTFLARSPAISLASVALETERQATPAGELMIRRLLEPGAERAKLVMPTGISIRSSTVS